MNEKKLFNAIIDINDELIEEAKIIKASKFKMKRILTVAASIVLIIGIGLLMKDMKVNKHIAPIAEVIYPKAYAFDDYDNWRKVIDENPVEDNTIRIINDFAYRTSSLILKETEENTNYSPSSLYYALALATTGSESDTEKELLDLLGMPDKRVSPYELILSPEEVKTNFEEGEDFHGEVVWKTPKFNFDSKFKFKDQLDALGVKLAFEPSADFTGITDHMAYMSDIQQETHISIDEERVEASAFTQIYYEGSAQPEDRADMIVDRPFIYGIIASNGNLLFIGICTNPVE